GQQPGFGPPPQPGQPGFGPPPQPGQPGFGPPPQPSQPGFGPPPQGPPPQGPPPQGPPPGQPGFGASGRIGVDGASGNFGVPSEAPEDDAEVRAMTLAEGVSLTGSTGLLRSAYAGSSAPGIWRVSFIFDWFTSGGFLCNADTPCIDPNGNLSLADDSASHVGGFFAINATPLSFLEAYAQLRTFANSNNLGEPGLLQVLGDTTLGVKAFTPFRIADNLTFGGDIRLLLLNGAGDVGPAGAGTSAEFSALMSSDFREIKGEGIGAPVRIHFNLGYRLDNSGNLVDDVEELRAQRNPAAANGQSRIPISRIERFGLGINRTDFFQLRLGVDVPTRYVQPYLEYSVDVPVNRQDYECRTSTASQGDVCLALSDFNDPNSGSIGYSGIPSRIGFGARTNPLKGKWRGLSGHLGFEVGLSATSTFIEEVAPQAPWTLYLGIGYAYDMQEEKAAPPPPPPPPPPVIPPPPPRYYVRGKVIDKDTKSVIPGAIVTLQSDPSAPPVASGKDGFFESYDLDPGSITFAVSADGYKDGSCTAVVTPAASPGAVAPFPGQPGGFAPPPPGQPGFPPGQPGAPGQPGGFPPPGGQVGLPPPAPADDGPIETSIECQLESLPKDGAVKGTVKSVDGKTVAGATIEVIDASGAKTTATTGADGSFSFPKMGLGKITVKAQADAYLLQVQERSVRPREDTTVNFTLTPRPQRANVRIVGNQVRVNKKIFFELNSATIKPESDAILSEIADVLVRNAGLKKVEIQGHTDNSGSPQLNRKLSDDRARAVKTWLTQHGVEGGRLEAKGYGSAVPLAPNVTPANRARNRRVQFVIREKQ
ncbi:MAG: OmpA family protein, partial [Myxococcota bacterium]